MGMVNIILSDDQTLFRQGVKKLIEGKVDYRVIGEAGNGLELIALLKNLYPDVIILNISMSQVRGIESIPEIKALRSAAKIIILTIHKEKDYLYQALGAGAHGYLLKDDSQVELFAAIRKVGKGEIYVSPRMITDSIEDWAKALHDSEKKAKSPKQLSKREREIIKLIAEGKKSKEIGSLLFISPRTVENHRAKIMAKLNLKNAAHLVKYALKNGYS